MKISFEGKIRKIKEFPKTINELRKIASRKFTEQNMLDNEQLGESRVS
jgi:hypothetical protein